MVTMEQSQTSQTEDQPLSEPPRFTRELKNTVMVKENHTLHLEAQIRPTNDPYLTIEWYKDGRILNASSRISSLNSFGFVSLTVRATREVDSGVYVCRAVNRWVIYSFVCTHSDL